MVGLDTMAGDVGYCSRGVDDCLSAKVQTQLGVLALPFEQCVMDNLGPA